MMTFEEAWDEVKVNAIYVCKKFRIDNYDFDDLMQEARMEVMNALKLYDESRGMLFKNYYTLKLRSKFNVLINKEATKKNYYNVRNNSVLKDDEDFYAYVSTDMPNPEELVLKQEAQKEAYDTLQVLHPELRKILILKTLGYNAREIAEQLNFTSNLVYHRFRLIEKLFKKKPSFEEIEEFNKEYDRILEKRKNLQNE